MSLDGKNAVIYGATGLLGARLPARLLATAPGSF
jgi:hypothetical protein